MKNIKPYLALMAGLAFLQACKKEEHTTSTSTKVVRTAELKDSVSFMMNGQLYVFAGSRNGVGFGNSAVNVKSSPVEIKGGKLAATTGRSFWYGSQDSTMYTTFYSWNAERSGSVKLGFAKRYNDKDMVLIYNYLQPKTNLEIFKLGEIDIATDLEKDNTKDGFFIDFHNNGSLSVSSRLPGSIMIRPSVPNDAQKNAKCTIMKLEDLGDGTFMLTAHFKMKMFDEEGKAYELKDGFMRFKVSSTPGLYLN